jgi:hypothetical protein
LLGKFVEGLLEIRDGFVCSFDVLGGNVHLGGLLKRSFFGIKSIQFGECGDLLKADYGRDENTRPKKGARI